MLQIAEVLEIGHHVAETGRRELESAAFGQGTGADGLAGSDVLHDDLPQHLAGAGVEIVTTELNVLDHSGSREL